MSAVRKQADEMAEIREDIGFLKAEVSNIKETEEKHYDLLVIINNSLSEMKNQSMLAVADLNNKVTSLHNRQDEEKKDRLEQISLIKSQIATEIMPKVERHETIIGKALWIGGMIVTGVTTLFTIILNLAPAVLGKIFP